jgi:serine/threonine-protein kinase
MLRDVAGGLAAVHRAGIVHRDVKPSNILLAAEGRAMLLDFGLARPMTSRDISTGSEIVGTPYYMAPEQCEGGVVDGRCDLYALGVTAYEALSGKRPFGGETPLQVLRAHLDGQPLPLHRAAPGVSESLARIVMRLVAKRADDRYPSAESLSEALASLD